MNAARWIGWVWAACIMGGPLRAQTTERVSVSSAGVEANGWSVRPALSADGRYVAFVSIATNLVTGDTNGFVDVFVRDRLSGLTERVSLDGAGQQGNAHSGFSGNQPVQPGISADGRFVLFQSGATNLFAGDTNTDDDILVRDRLLGTTECVSRDSSGNLGNGWSDYAALSADGRFVSFRSDATNLVPGDSNLLPDVFVRDRIGGSTTRVSIDSAGNQGNFGSFNSAISADGRFVAFTSAAANFDPTDGGFDWDVFVRDRLNGTIETASVDTSGGIGTGDSILASISADGRFVTLHSNVTTLAPGDFNGTWDVFRRDRQAHTTIRVSVGSTGLEGNGVSSDGGTSVDGRYVLFDSLATNLVPNDNNNSYDAFVHDVQAGTTERVSVDSSGNESPLGSGPSSISGDGLFIVFASASANLAPGDTNLVSDVFVRTRSGLPVMVFCSGDGTSAACPCGNSGAPWRGCENSASTGGARLSLAGSASLANDTLVLTSGGELPSAFSIFVQGTASMAQVAFGDGLLCTGGFVRRLYALSASGGVVSAPPPSGPSISVRSATLGDNIVPGTTRYYQTYYRDPVLAFCANPPGNSWNVSSGLSIVWDP